jgi:FMN phosphatase YigB (HAD superfamily)
MTEFIYFDLGNVLVSFEHSRAWQQVAELTGLSPQRVEQVLFNGGLQVQYEKGEISTQAFHRFFCKQAQVDISLEDLNFAVSNIFEPIAETIQLLGELQWAGHRLGLLSNTCDCHWQFLLDDDRFKFLHSSFEQTILSFVVGCAKPESDIYRIAAKRANCEPGSVLFIDDLQENVSAAKLYGFEGIHFQSSFDLIEQLKKIGLLA